MADEQEQRTPPPDDDQHRHHHAAAEGTHAQPHVPSLLLSPPPEPVPRASNADNIDESSLLAETEDLLATLDPSAFVRSGSAAHNDDAVPVSTVAVSALLPVARGRRGRQPTVSQAAESSTVSSVPPPALPPVRDKRKEEIQQLRTESAALESQLVQLQHQHQSAVRVRDKRQQIWQELVARQSRLRQLAERENQQLKVLLQNMLRIDSPLQLESSLGLPSIPGRALSDRLPNYMHGPYYKALPPPQRDADLAAVFEPMLRRLDVGHAELDAVFSENGLHQELTEPRCYAERKTRRLGQPCHFIELIDVRFLPFPWIAVGNTTWECNKTHNLTESDSHVYHCAERPEDSFAVCYRKQHAGTTSGGQQQKSMECKLVMRRYVEAHRIVLVCSNQIQGENELAGATTSDIGYLSMSNANRLSEPGSPVTVIRCCMHVFSKSDQSEEKLNNLLNLMVSAYEEDVRFVRQQVDTALLMQQHHQHAPSSRASISVVQEHEEEEEEQKGEAAEFPTQITFHHREDRTRR